MPCSAPLGWISHPSAGFKLSIWRAGRPPSVWDRGRWGLCLSAVLLGDDILRGGGPAVPLSVQVTFSNSQKIRNIKQKHQKQLSWVPQYIFHTFSTPPQPLPPPFFSPVSNRHHFFDGDLLYQFWINFRRRRRLTELLNENSSRTLSESPDSPFCLRKLNPDPGNTSFLSGNCACVGRGG